MPILVDSNVLLDVLTEDPRWSSWSMKALAERAERDLLAINPIIYAEVSIGFVRIEEIDAALPPSTFHRLALPWEPPSSRASAFWRTASEAAYGRRRCRTSTSARTPACQA